MGLLILLLVLLAITIITYDNDTKETFIPKNVKQSFRPIQRSLKIYYEGFYNKTSTTVTNIFRKINII